MDDYALWQAGFSDGSVINQKDEGASYEELDRENLIVFNLLRPDGSVIIHAPFRPGQGGRLIWRRRVLRSSDGQEARVYIIGKRGAFVAMVNMDYSIMIDDTFHEDNSLFSNIEPVKGEDG